MGEKKLFKHKAEEQRENKTKQKKNPRNNKRS